MTTLFISDLHLEEARRDITDAFLAFLTTEAAEATHLYILGDFFEAWIGDDEKTELQQEITQALKSYTASGRKLSIMHGNRDFLIGQQFASETGAELLEDPTLIELGGKKTVLLHGDSLCTKDVAYMKFRQNMRNPQWQTLFLERPLADRKTTAQQLRAISMAKNKGKKEEIMDVTEEEVISLLDNFDAEIMIHGHTHRPKRHNLKLSNGNQAERIVLGDWDKNLWHLSVTDDNTWDLVSKPL